mgnify:CR=1 FL=1
MSETDNQNGLNILSDGDDDTLKRSISPQKEYLQMLIVIICYYQTLYYAIFDTNLTFIYFIKVVTSYNFIHM